MAFPLSQRIESTHRRWQSPFWRTVVLTWCRWLAPSSQIPTSSSKLYALDPPRVWLCVVLCCVVLCCAVLCCAVLCCAVLCCFQTRRCCLVVHQQSRRALTHATHAVMWCGVA